MAQDPSKTEKATGKKRSKSRSEGTVCKSQEINSAAVLIFGVAGLFFFGKIFFGGLINLSRHIFSHAAQIRIDEGELGGVFALTAVKVILAMFPVIATLMLAAFLANYFQIGLKISTKPIRPKFSNMNPVNGAKKIISPMGLVEMVKTEKKIGVVGYIVYITVKGVLPQIPHLMGLEPPAIVLFLFRTFLKIFVRLIPFLIFLAAIDYAYQRYQHEEKIKMTKQEVKDERKDVEGDPQVKSRIRSIQFSMARKRMMDAIPEADVVITNPTRLAIALQYDRQRSPAPRVTAKGAGFLAERIRETARASHVPVLERKALAQTLYKMAEIDQEIPPSLYEAVAEVLAYIYQIQGKAHIYTQAARS